MTRAYFNYPEPHVTLHTNGHCNQIGKNKTANQRCIHITTTSLSSSIQQVRSKSFRFVADSARNDLWIFVDFSDSEFEDAVIRYILRQFASRYRPFQGVTPKPHC